MANRPICIKTNLLSGSETKDIKNGVTKKRKNDDKSIIRTNSFSFILKFFETLWSVLINTILHKEREKYMRANIICKTIILSIPKNKSLEMMIGKKRHKDIHTNRNVKSNTTFTLEPL